LIEEEAQVLFRLAVHHSRP